MLLWPLFWLCLAQDLCILFGAPALMHFLLALRPNHPFPLGWALLVHLSSFPICLLASSRQERVLKRSFPPAPPQPVLSPSKGAISDMPTRAVKFAWNGGWKVACWVCGPQALLCFLNPSQAAWGAPAASPVDGPEPGSHCPLTCPLTCLCVRLMGPQPWSNGFYLYSSYYFSSKP